MPNIIDNFSKPKVLLLVFLSLFVLALGFYYTILILPQTHTITFTDKGFSPQEITIGKGDTVVFKTDTKKDFWPASNSHPVHDIYPEFDAKKPVKPGESWSFKFQKTGIWRFHDHMHPIYEGTVIVGKLNSKITDCDTGKNLNEDCLLSTFKKSLETEGLEKTFDLVANMYASNSTFVSYCHDITHQIGRASYDLYEKEGEVKLSPKASYCGYGFYHGFMEKLLSVGQDFEKASHFCMSLSIEETGVSPESGCFHGLGHAALALSAPKNIDNEKTMINESIEFCKRVGKEREYINGCYGGVFMELSTYYLTNEYNLSFDRRDPLSICRRQEGDVRVFCYEQTYALLSSASGKDLLKAISFLYEITDRNTLEYSVQNLVGSMTDKSSRFENLETCRKIERELREFCIRGIVLSIKLYGSLGEALNESEEFCSSQDLKPEEKTMCNKAIQKLQLRS